MGQYDALSFNIDSGNQEAYDADVISTGSRSYAHIRNTPAGLRKLEIYREQKELEHQLKDDLTDTW